MLRRLPGIDRGRYAEPAALVCCIALGALALWLFVRLAWSLVPRGDAAFDSAPARFGGATAPLPAQSIARWHLFGQTPPRPGDDAGPATMLSLILRGTLAERDPAAGMAVIADAQGSERAYRVGDQVAGARLAGVYPDHVVIAHAGTRETLKLPRDGNLAPADIVRPTPATVSSRGASQARAAAPRSMPSAAAANHGVTAPADWRRTVERLRQDPAELARRVQIVPVITDGRLAGVRLSAGSDAGLMRQIGLRPGDIVTMVNGTPIDSVARGEQIMSSLGSSGPVRITVLRDGKPTALTVVLQ